MVISKIKTNIHWKDVMLAGAVTFKVTVDPKGIVAGMPLSVGRVFVRYGGERYSTPDRIVMSEIKHIRCILNVRYSVWYFLVETSALGLDPANIILPSLYDMRLVPVSQNLAMDVREKRSGRMVHARNGRVRQSNCREAGSNGGLWVIKQRLEHGLESGILQSIICSGHRANHQHCLRWIARSGLRQSHSPRHPRKLRSRSRLVHLEEERPLPSHGFAAFVPPPSRRRCRLMSR
jgi:hypothetical protein